MKYLLSILLLSIFVSCGGPKIKERKLEEREHTRISRDYEVRDASSDVRPGWIEDAELWAKQSRQDIEKYRYFSYETTPKVNRKVACKLAKANAKSDIASEITSFIEDTLGSYSEGEANIDMNNPKLRPMKDFIETTLTSKTMALIHGAQINKTYWEKRQYMEDRGAKKDFTAWTCAVLVKMDGKQLSTLVNEASNYVAKNATDPEMKAKVENALKNANENFIKARKGEL